MKVYIGVSGNIVREFTAIKARTDLLLAQGQEIGQNIWMRELQKALTLKTESRGWGLGQKHLGEALIDAWEQKRTKTTLEIFIGIKSKLPPYWHILDQGSRGVVTKDGKPWFYPHPKTGQLGRWIPGFYAGAKGDPFIHVSDVINLGMGMWVTKHIEPM